MKKKRLFIIFLILLIMMLGSVSCNSTRRASRRIGRILENHPELVSYDTVHIDTVIPILPPSDSIVIDETELDTTTMVAHRTEHGTFHVQKLPNQNIKIIYTPDTTRIRHRETIVVPHVIYEQKKHITFSHIVTIIVFAFIGFLFFRLFYVPKN